MKKEEEERMKRRGWKVKVRVKERIGEKINSETAETYSSDGRSSGVWTIYQADAVIYISDSIINNKFESEPSCHFARHNSMKFVHSFFLET